MKLRQFYYALPPNLRMIARRLFYFPLDLWETITRQRHPYQPPRGEIYIGSGDFIGQGQHQLALLQRFIQLRPDDSVLDIGSGIGRTALPLTSYLDAEGRYEGFDVVEKGVRWCQKKISKDHPNFNFRYIPLNNDLYNISREQASQFTFPYPGHSFDKVFLFSVFTHMQLAEVAHYLCEIHRVLKVGGLCLATFFIFDTEEEETIADKNRNFAFPVKRAGYRLMDAKVSSANIAFELDRLIIMVQDSGLKIRRQVRGYWKDIGYKTEVNSFQDILVLEKPG